jgi:hypothetical protein
VDNVNSPEVKVREARRAIVVKGLNAVVSAESLYEEREKVMQRQMRKGDCIRALY